VSLRKSPSAIGKGSDSTPEVQLVDMLLVSSVGMRNHKFEIFPHETKRVGDT
jgi:hypothetical protein